MLSIKDICTKGNEYFFGSYIYNLAILEKFEESLDEETKRIFRHLGLFLEAALPLKLNVRKGVFINYGEMYGKELWYGTHVMLLIGLIDQLTKDIKFPEGHEKEGNTLGLDDRFKSVMDCLHENEQAELTRYYRAEKGFQNFEAIVKDIYSSRSVFAHFDSERVSEHTPENSTITFSTRSDGYVIHLNMDAGQVLLLILIAVLRYLGLKDKLEIRSVYRHDLEF